MSLLDTLPVNMEKSSWSAEKIVSFAILKNLKEGVPQLCE